MCFARDCSSDRSEWKPLPDGSRLRWSRGRIGGAVLGSDRDDAQGAAGAVDDLEWGGDDDRAGGGKLIQIAEAGQAEFAAAVHDEVIREGRIEGGRAAGISADGLHADAE